MLLHIEISITAEAGVTTPHLPNRKSKSRLDAEYRVVVFLMDSIYGNFVPNSSNRNIEKC